MYEIHNERDVTFDLFPEVYIFNNTIVIKCSKIAIEYSTNRNQVSVISILGTKHISRYINEIGNYLNPSRTYFCGIITHFNVAAQM